jgi:lipopolysaccharide/colanic/teichoic acid biosynthesis glycosyltransferase
VSGVKRLFDIVASSVGILVLSPALCAIALLIKADSSGPVFFRQQRIGRNAKPFLIYKFRTMRQEESGKGLQLTVSDDARITRVGAALRHFKLDELPQLINVLTGDMSVVGPRPEVPRYVDKWDDSTRSVVLSVRPGMTDLASILYRNESALLSGSDNPERKYVEEIAPAKSRLAVQYVRNQSLWLDVRIIFRTFLAILR